MTAFGELCCVALSFSASLGVIFCDTILFSVHAVFISREKSCFHKFRMPSCIRIYSWKEFSNLADFTHIPRASFCV